MVFNLALQVDLIIFAFDSTFRADSVIFVQMLTQIAQVNALLQMSFHLCPIIIYIAIKVSQLF